MQAPLPIVIVGAGPVGLALALMLARQRVESTVLDARTLEAARMDRRLLALSHGTLDLLRPLIDLPPSGIAAIRAVDVSSSGQFGRVVLRESDGDAPLGATLRYGELLGSLAEAAKRDSAVAIRRPRRARRITQHPGYAEVQLDSAEILRAALVVNAEGGAHAGYPVSSSEPRDVAIVADLGVTGPAAGTAYERFTREGPLALLPLPEPPAAKAARALGLVWCMPAVEARRRLDLADEAFASELQQALGGRKAKVVDVGPLTSYPLHQNARGALVEHRMVHIGNAAQTVHPVAGQGLNLGMRDGVELADRIARAHAAALDPLSELADYERARRADRGAIIALTRGVPPLFATRAAPLAFGRSIALTMLSTVPELRREFARLLMFGVRG